MKSIEEVRRENLLRLIEERCNNSQTQAATRLGYERPTLVNHWVKGRKQMESGTARTIEGAFDLPVNWMDSEHESAENDVTRKAHNPVLITDIPEKSGPMIGKANVAPGPALRGEIPLISWAQARTWDQLVNAFAEMDAEDWLDCPVEHSNKSFCLRVIGDGMDDGTSEGYREGEIIFIDPEGELSPGDDVIVRAADGTLMFRRLKEDSEGPYLLVLNGKNITRVPAGADFLGVVIFSGVKRKKRRESP